MSGRACPLALGLLLLGSLAVAAADTPALIAPYLVARDEGQRGTVAGEAYAEPARPSGPAAPYADVSVVLLPSTPDLEAELDRIRAGIRESARAYLGSAERLRAAREAFERELVFSGGGELIRGEVSDAAGRFRFVDVPAGSWLLLAWREAPHVVPARRVPPRDVGGFTGNPETTGYAALEYWRLTVEVRPGESTPVRLHDRSVWLTVVREDKRTPESKTPAEGSGSKRRQGTTR
jgi:hypothetical protein